MSFYQALLTGKAPKKNGHRMPLNKYQMKKQSFKWTVPDILDAVNGQHLFGTTEHAFDNISIDSRSVNEHSLFVAIVGERFDSHDFISNIANQPIRGVLIQQDKVSQSQIQLWKNKNLLCISVSDTTKALGDLGRYQRIHWGGSVVGITGTNGKTSVKELTASVLATTYNTIKTCGNFNNHIGVPKTLFQIQLDHQWAVVEMGMNHLGEIAYLADICQPDVGIVTNIGPGHLEGVDSIEGVRKAKGELIAHLDRKDIAILNADDPLVLSYRDHCKCAVLTYGMNSNAQISATAILESMNGCKFELKTPDGCITVQLPAPGKFMISNALAAAAVGYYAKIPLESIKTALASYVPIKGRSFIRHHPDGFHIIDDTYNANPASMRAAIDNLKQLSTGNNAYFVCGDMYELGTETERYHKEIGSHAAKSGLSGIFVTGNFDSYVQKGAIEAGFDKKAICTGSHKDIARTLFKRLKPGDWVLVKGSRAMKMEQLIEMIA
jgi:UDP-N-acetylmuramoyl-tripeptide--D-alanyl-D-alanine ligase